MRHIVRRIVYLGLGLAPTVLWILAWLWAGDAYFAGSLLMFVSLVIATTSRIPAAKGVRIAVALLTLVGMLICWQSSTTDQFFSGVIHALERQKPGDLGYAVKTSWFLFGPLLCAAHFVARSRCAPNNSFKPKPLRGSA